MVLVREMFCKYVNIQQTCRKKRKPLDIIINKKERKFVIHVVSFSMGHVVHVHKLQKCSFIYAFN
jgi:hypothetical protein